MWPQDPPCWSVLSDPRVTSRKSRRATHYLSWALLQDFYSSTAEQKQKSSTQATRSSAVRSGFSAASLSAKKLSLPAPIFRDCRNRDALPRVAAGRTASLWTCKFQHESSEP